MLKKLSFIFVIALLLGGSALAFAWWDNLEQTETNQELEIGQGVRLTVADETTSGQGLLVPQGSFYASGAEYTTHAAFSYELSLEEGALADGFVADLTVTLENLALELNGDTFEFEPHLFTLKINDDPVTVGTVTTSIGGSNEYSYTITFDEAFYDENGEFTVDLQITLKEHPDSNLDASDYAAVAGKNLTFDISFELE